MAVDHMSAAPLHCSQVSFETVTAALDTHQDSAHHASYTYTSGMDLCEELKVQGDMLLRVSAQQKFILDELTKMRASRGLLPVADMADQMAPAAGVCT